LFVSQSFAILVHQYPFEVAYYSLYEVHSVHLALFVVYSWVDFLSHVALLVHLNLNLLFALAKIRKTIVDLGLPVGRMVYDLKWIHPCELR